MSKWPIVQLKDVGIISTGTTPPTANEEFYSSNDISFVKPNDFVEGQVNEIDNPSAFISEGARNSARIVPIGSILTTCIGIIGKVGIAKNETAFNQQINAIIPNPKVCDGKYLAYAILSQKKLIEAIANSAVVPIINKSQFSNVRIPLPSLPEQKRIAETLDRAQRLIDIRKKQIEEMDKLAQAVFIEMFGDPVRNEKGWEKVSLGEVSNSRLGKMLDGKKQDEKTQKPYLANQNVQWMEFRLDDLNTMSFSEEDIKEFALLYGDVLVCEGGIVGRSAIWKDQMRDCYFQKALHRLRCDKNRLTAEYLVYFFWFISKLTGFSDVVDTVTIAHLTGIKLKKMLIPLPPIEMQNAFKNFFDEICNRKLAFIEGLSFLEQNYNILLLTFFS